MVQAVETSGTVDWAAVLAELEEQYRDRTPGWLQAARRAALERFVALGFPTPRAEAWKYTSLAPVARGGFVPALAEPDVKLPAAAAWPADAALRLVFVDGHLASALSDTAHDALAVRGLADVLSGEPELVRWATTPVVDLPPERTLEALNTTFAVDGAVIEVPRGVELDRPVHVVFLATHPGAPRATFPRVLVHAHETSRALVVESHLPAPGAGDTPAFTDALTQVRVEPGAAVDHVRLQAEGDTALHVATTDALVARDGRFSSHVLALGAALGRSEVRVTLDGPGASCALGGLYLADGTRHLDCQTFVDHAQPHGTSAQVYRGLADDRGRGVFGGRVLVRPDAQRSDASQSSKSLLLSREAAADAKPQLEIHADDVRCSHGATVSALEDDSVFYLRSRGVDEAAARRLLTLGFADEVLAAVPDGTVRDRAAALLRERLQRKRS